MTGDTQRFAFRVRAWAFDDEVASEDYRARVYLYGMDAVTHLSFEKPLSQKVASQVCSRYR